MAKRLILLGMAIFLLAAPVRAGGDKVRGDKGAGAIAQNQVGWHGYERRP